MGLLERNVHATTARQRALQHWDFGTPRINFSSHIQTKGFKQRPPPEKSLKLASCQTRPVASLFGQRFCSYPKCIFLGGWKRMGWRAFRWRGGGESMVENCVPWHCCHNSEGGVNVWSKERGGGKRTKFLVTRNQKAVPSRTQSNLQPLLAQNSVLPLGGCGEELALRLHLAFGTGLLSDFNVRRIGHEGFSDWCCIAQETWKAPPSQNIWENSSLKPQNFGAVTPPPFSPPFWLRLINLDVFWHGSFPLAPSAVRWGYSRSSSRNGTHDLVYAKSLFSEQLSERLSELVGRQNFSSNSWIGHF